MKGSGAPAPSPYIFVEEVGWAILHRLERTTLLKYVRLVFPSTDASTQQCQELIRDCFLSVDYDSHQKFLVVLRYIYIVSQKI